MPQQLILEIEHYYPFGQIQTDGTQQKIFVRKRIQYNNQEMYAKICEKISIIKKLKHPILIPLVRLLQQQGSFHLIYEYTPHRFDTYLQKLTNDQIEALKKKLIFFSSFLYDNKIDVNFQSRNVGFNKALDLKYYVDIDFIVLDRLQQAIKNKYVLQINKIFSNIKMYNDRDVYIAKGHFSQKRQNLLLADETKSNKIIFKKNDPSKNQVMTSRQYSPPYVHPFQNNFQDRELSRYTSNQSKYKQKSVWTTKSKVGEKIPLPNHTLLLNSIQQKIQQINKNLKRVNTKKSQNINSTNNINNGNGNIISSQNYQLKNGGVSLRQSAKQKQTFNKQIKNISDRKLSIQVSKISSFGKNNLTSADTASSVKNHKINPPSIILQNIKQNSEESQNNLGTGTTPKQRKQSINQRKQSMKQRKQSLKIKDILTQKFNLIQPPPPPNIVSNNSNSKVYNNKNKVQVKQSLNNSPSTNLNNGIYNTESINNGLIRNNSKQQQSPLLKQKKQPLTKRDFQQLKKNQFQSFFNSKQSYVQQFLGVLDDVEEDMINNNKSIRSNTNVKESNIINNTRKNTLLTVNQKNGLDPYVNKNNINSKNNKSKLIQSPKYYQATENSKNLLMIPISDSPRNLENRFQRTNKLISTQKQEKRLVLKQKSAPKIIVGQTLNIIKAATSRSPVIDQKLKSNNQKTLKSNVSIQQINYNQKQLSSSTLGIPISNTKIPATATISLVSSPQTSPQNSPQTSIQIIPLNNQGFKKQQKNIQLKSRISKALQKCEIAFMKYRKQSVHNISTQYLNKK